MNRRTRRALAVSLLVLAPAAAQAGAPLTCFPMAIGDARSLAWGTGTGWNTPDPAYDRARLAADTLALLGPRTPVLVRMETLRRAMIYASAEDAAAKQLFDALRGRAAGKGAASVDPLFHFDLGYAVETYRQARHALDKSPADPPEDGYALVRKALEARDPDPEMEYAAALVTLGSARDGLSERHLRAAVAGAAEGSDLARTLVAHQPVWGDRIRTAKAAAR